MLTAEQKHARLGKITSSIAAAALGLDKRTTPLGAWLQIKGEDHEPEKEVALEKACDRGNRLEDLILRYPAEKRGLCYKPAPFRGHPKHNWAADSCDALYLDMGYPTPDHDPEPTDEMKLVAIGEGKSASLGVAKGYGDEQTDDIPETTLIQSHWHLIHWPEVDTCYVPVLVGGYAFEFREYVVERDTEFEGILLDDLAQWHRDYVVADKPPPVQAGDESWVKRKYPQALQGFAASTPEIAGLAEAYQMAHHAEKVAKESKKAAGARLRQLLAEHEGVVDDWGKVYFRNSKERTDVDWEAIVDALGPPDSLIQKHTHTRPGPRSLRVYLTKED